MSDKYLETVINDLAEQYGPEVVVTEVTRMLGAAVPSPTNRGPQTAVAAGSRRRSVDLARFSSSSLPGRLLYEFYLAATSVTQVAAFSHGLTAFEAAREVLGHHAPVTRFEGCRRRVSDLLKVGYIADSGERRPNPGTADESVVWRITPLGDSAFEAMTEHGWTKRAPAKPAKAAA